MREISTDFLKEISGGGHDPAIESRNQSAAHQAARDRAAADEAMFSAARLARWNRVAAGLQYP